MMLQTTYFVVAALLIIAGIAGAILPALPGVPLVFGGMWMLSRFHSLAGALQSMVDISPGGAPGEPASAQTCRRNLGRFR